MLKSKMFQKFNDGRCGFYLIDEDGNAGTLKESLPYEERTVGYKRYYEAMTNKVKADRLIRVPNRPWLTTEYLAAMDGDVYELKQVQLIPDANPPSRDVTLHLARQRRVTDGKI